MIDHLSYSSISTYLSCGAYWQKKYSEKISVPTAPELAFGSAFHNTVEEFIGNGHQGNIADLWNVNWNNQLEKDQSIDWGTDGPELFYNQGLRMFTNPEIRAGILSIKTHIWPGEQSKPAIETKVELQVPGVPIPIVGYIDIITDGMVPGDFKTSAKSWTLDKALSETQPLFYLAALNQIGIQVEDLKFRHYVFVKTKEPKFQVMEHVHNINQLFWLFRMIKHVWDGIEAGIFTENPTGWKCSPNYCEYWSICRGR